MSFARFIVLGAIVLALSACASIKKTKATKPETILPPTKGLPAQVLSSGECGIFLWTISTPRTFVFFQKQGDNNARYYAQDTEITLQTTQNMAGIDDLEGLVIDYNAPGFETINIKGKFSETLEGGRRISDATIKTKKSNAWEEIQPVSGVYVCR